MDNNKSNLSLVLSIIALVILMFWPTMKFALPVFIIATGLAVVAIVFGFKSKKTGSGKATAAIVIGFIAAIWGLLAIFGLYALSNVDMSSEYLCPDANKVTECIKNDDNTATCKYMGTVEIKCSTEKLVDTQYKN